jgi:hypothetical protein
MLCRRKLAHTMPTDGREAVGAKARWCGDVLALAAGLLAASLSTAAAVAAGKVNVLYAGSLATLMEHSVGPAFDKATGSQFQGYEALGASSWHQGHWREPGCPQVADERRQ